MQNIPTQKLSPNAILPTYATLGAAGMDLYACVTEPITIKPNKLSLIPTGIALALPTGMEAQIRPRSGLAFNYGITVLNSPGTIDSDYRGEIKVLLINHGENEFVIDHGMRIAQMVIANYAVGGLNLCDDITQHKSERGKGGFGSTGL